MWKLKTLKATNICTFSSINYDLTQDCATLIFGDNQDNDSQNSNGSGKSALLEAISLALTGQTLRDVKTVDAIINDASDTCEVSVVLFNPDENSTMQVSRTFDRGSIQSIRIVENDKENVQSGIADYNKYILDRIGLSKEEIFSNFILSKQRFRPFLSVNDKDKKDIINKFSNGILVDQSIEALHTDMAPLQDRQSTTEKDIAATTGSINTLKETVEATRNSEKAAVLSKEERIKGWKEDIAGKRKEIRELQESYQRGEVRKKLVEETLPNQVETLENSTESIGELYVQLQDILRDNNLTALQLDYGKVVEDSLKKLESCQKSLKASDKSIKSLEKALKTKQKEFDAYKKDHEKKRTQNEKDRETLNEELTKLRTDLTTILETLNKAREERNKVASSIARLETQLAGVITCPHCKKEFFLDASKESPEKLKEKLAQEQKAAEFYDATITESKKSEKEYTDKGVAKKKTLMDLVDQDDKNKEDYLEHKHVVTDAEELLAEEKISQANISAQISTLSTATQTERRKMFQEAYNILDSAVTATKKGLTDLEMRIESANGSIKIFEDNIKAEQERSTSNAEMIKSLEENIIKNEDKLLKLMTEKSGIEAELGALKVQEANFTKFKTHLANTKIQAIEQITNEFLEMLGSDMRVVLSGYTTLKSGKVRDKISVTLLRDGVDCGVFQKLSAGEQARIQLANILAMYQLTNQKCSTGKGLDLLIIDEVLDASDEDGLAAVFAALNNMKITSLVVSHGNIAENYEHRLIVQKSDGVSKIIT